MFTFLCVREALNMKNKVDEGGVYFWVFLSFSAKIEHATVDALVLFKCAGLTSSPLPPQYHKTIEAVYSVENSVETLLDLLQRYREKAGDKVAEKGGSIFTKACFLLALLLQDKQRTEVRRHCNKQITRVHKYQYQWYFYTRENANYFAYCIFFRRSKSYPRSWIGSTVFTASLLANTRWTQKEQSSSRRWARWSTGASSFQWRLVNPALHQSMDIPELHNILKVCLYVSRDN